MIYFLIRVILGSIIGVLLGIWFSRKVDFIPANIKRKYSILIQTIYTIALTIALTFLSFTDVYLSWVILIALSFLIWSFSSWFIHYVAQSRREQLQRDDTAPPIV